MIDIVFSTIVLMFGVYITTISIMVYTTNRFYFKVIPFFGGLMTIFYVLYNLKIFTINV